MTHPDRDTLARWLYDAGVHTDAYVEGRRRLTAPARDRADDGNQR